MQGVIEEMYEQNNQTKVTIVVHSMGGPVSLYFLNNIVTQAWKDQYIHAYVPLSGAWDGGALMMEALLSGVNEFGFLNTPRLWRELTNMTRTFQGSYWLVPSSDSLGTQHVIAEVGSDRYTTTQYDALFQRAGITEGFTKYTNAKAINSGWIAPNVSTHCFYGLFPNTNNTPEAFIYAADGFPNNKPTTVRMGFGDTVVNAQISEICLQWMNQSAGFTSRTFEAIHIEMVSNASVLAAIGDIVGAPRDPRLMPAPSGDPTSPSGGICPASVATVIAATTLLALLVILLTHMVIRRMHLS